MEKIFISIINSAIKNQCSDIHIEVLNNILKLYYRFKGKIIKIQSQYNIPIELINYIAFKANLDVIKVENLATGMINYQYNKNNINLRVSLISNDHHKSMVIRIINNHKLVEINNICYYQFQKKILSSILKLENGLIIFSGKTGSGKTTTLYALLHELKKINKRIISVENPIEKSIFGITQIDISKKHIEMSQVFEQILRHDPDVIVFGEIRNNFELEYVINAALSGHLVLVTIHALNSKYVVNKLKSLKISEQDIKAVIKLIFYQRLFYTKKQDPVVVFEYLNNNLLNEILIGNKIKQMTIEKLVSNDIKIGNLYEGK